MFSIFRIADRTFFVTPHSKKTTVVESIFWVTEIMVYSVHNLMKYRCAPSEFEWKKQMKTEQKTIWLFNQVIYRIHHNFGYLKDIFNHCGFFAKRCRKKSAIRDTKDRKHRSNSLFSECRHSKKLFGSISSIRIERNSELFILKRRFLITFSSKFL